MTPTTKQLSTINDLHSINYDLDTVQIKYIVIISICWVAGAGVGFLPLLGWHAAAGDHPDCYFVEVMDYDYLLFLYLATIITPSLLLVLFYAHIYRVVVKQHELNIGD
ncbi:unnamed protein product [Plutella xylostella]|uniref:(diamondback moth) hypothetical protein n=1 Tax=Plutella xylostella TaxID=51655 RepID=A0A8S4EIR1_PLUXY|nr:unnamed protein product [Plutella xylostella]